MLFQLIEIYYFLKRMEVRIVEAENQFYQKEKLLGQGAFGKAYLVKQKHTGQQLVIKEVSIDHMSQKQREQTIKEAQILRNFRHPLIVKFVEVYATKQNKLKIVMQYAECGDLSKAITARKNSKKMFEETQILDWFTQICLAMKHVHDRKILHRDIKGQNIFITKANTLKLGDFGIARVLNKTADKARTVVGTPYYLSPQIIQNKPYSFKSDVWSMGVLLYEMCALAPPFTATSLQFLALKIVKGSYTQLSGYSQQLKSLVAEMLQLDPNRRPGVGDILKKPFLQDRIRKYLSQTYRKEQFSHTILHNQKFEIANKLVKIQAKVQAKKDNNISQEREKLKEEASMLKEQMYIKKQQEEQQLRRRREEDQKRRDEQNQRKRQYEARKREQDMQRRRQNQQKEKQIAQLRAVQERKQWIERQKRKQQEMLQREDEIRRVQEIAQMGKRRQKEEQQMIARKEKLLQEKYALEREKEDYDSKLKQKQQKERDNKKMEEFNQLARKQWYQNQQIRKRAEERARQAEMQAYGQAVEPEAKEEEHRPQSSRSGQRNSRQKNIYDHPKKHSMPTAIDVEEEELQNAMMNPNFKHKKDPASKLSRNSTNASNWSQKQKEQPKKKEEPKTTAKKNYAEDRQRMRRDREQFIKKKTGGQQPVVEKTPEETLKPAKWGKNSRSKSRESPRSSEKIEQPVSQEESQVYKVSVMDEKDLRLNIKDQQEFNDYLNELQGLIGNVNKNIQKMNPLPEMEVVEEQIVVRDDDNDEFDYSITASFDGALLPKKEEINTDDADLDYFSSYEKLESLRICLEDKFGTDNFIKIYRTIEQELQEKQLENFNILEVIKRLGDIPNSHLVSENLPLLLTLVVMEDKMSSC